MMDPLSVSASVIAILQLSGKIISACIAYISSVRDAPKDLRTIMVEIQSLQAIVRVMDLTSSQSTRVDDGLGAPLEACRASLKELSDLLDHQTTQSSPQVGPPAKKSKTLPTLSSLAWPLKHRRVKALMEDISRHKATITLSLTANWRSIGLNLSVEVNNLQSRIQDETNSNMKSALCAWLCSPNVEENYSTLAARRCPGTCLWIFDHPTYQEWIRDGGILWLNGIAGIGKSVLCATVIQRLQIESTTTQESSPVLAYFYFDRAELDKRSASHLLSAIVSQLINQNERCFSLVFDFATAKLGSTSKLWQAPATLSTLETILIQILNALDIVLIVDAVDEGDNTREIVSLLIRLAVRRAKIFFTSRPDITIRRAFDSLEDEPNRLREISIDPDTVSRDVQAYVSIELDNLLRSKEMTLRDPTLKAEIVTSLTKRSEGMFLLAYCHLANLPDYMSDRDILQSLTQLPVGLCNAYDHMLKQIEVSTSHKRSTKFALRLFRWIAFSCRPLTLGELCVAISIEDDDLDLDLSNVITDPWNILKIGGSLLAYDHETSRVGFAHHTVREFLVQHDKEAAAGRTFCVTATESHTLLASTCLQYLQFPSVITRMGTLEYGVMFTPGQLHENEFSFVHYAAKFWSTHVQQVTTTDEEGVSVLLRKFFFGPRRGFDAWQKVCDPPSTKGDSGNEFGPVALALCQLERERGRDPYSFAKTAPTKSTSSHISRSLNFATPQMEPPRHQLERQASEERVRQYVFNWNRGPLSPLHYLSRSRFPTILREALDSGWPPNVYGGLLRSTPLHVATKADSTTTAQLLLDAGANVNSEDSLGRTPLFYASQAGSVDMVCLLMARNARATQSDWYRSSPLHEATRMGNLSVVKVLLGRNILDTPDARGNTALSLSLQGKAEDISVSLLEGGAMLRLSDVPYVLELGSERLLRAIARRHNRRSYSKTGLLIRQLSRSIISWNLELLRQLINCGLLIDNQESDGSNTLCMAIANTYGRARPPKGIEILLSHGALCRQKTGTTCLHNLASYKDTEAASDLVQRLIDAGCGLEAENSDGHTPFLHAVYSRRPTLASKLLSLGSSPRLESEHEPRFFDALDLNWMSRCEVNCGRHKYGKYARSVENLLAQLFDRGLSINSRNRISETILHTLCSTRLCQASVYLMDWVMKNGGDVSLANPLGDTPLHILFGNNKRCKETHGFESMLVDVIMAMVRSIPDINVRNLHGRTPLEVLVEQDIHMWSLKAISSYKTVVVFLLDAGAEVTSSAIELELKKLAIDRPGTPPL